MSLKDGKLTGEPLQISASSYTAYENCCPNARDGDFLYNYDARTSVKVTIGNTYKPIAEYDKSSEGYRDITDPAQITEAIILGKTIRRTFECSYENGNKDMALKVCNRFLEPKGEVKRLLKVKHEQEKAEQERQKRIKRFGELRKLVEKKRAKLEEKQKRQAEKERLLKNQQAKNAFLR